MTWRARGRERGRWSPGREAARRGARGLWALGRRVAVCRVSTLHRRDTTASSAIVFIAPDRDVTRASTGDEARLHGGSRASHHPRCAGFYPDRRLAFSIPLALGTSPHFRGRRVSTDARAHRPIPRRSIPRSAGPDATSRATRTRGLSVVARNETRCSRSADSRRRRFLARRRALGPSARRARSRPRPRARVPAEDDSLNANAAAAIASSRGARRRTRRSAR